MNYINSKGIHFTFYLSTETQEILTYLLVVPQNLQDGKELIVEALNFETTNILSKIIPYAIQHVKDMVEIFDDAPIIIPFIPTNSKGIPYYQQLSRECFVKPSNKEYKIAYPRIDLQVVNTINNAKEAVKLHTKKNVLSKIFLSGYSTSGVFAQRFALIHPEIVGRVLIGGASGSIPLPSVAFDYPIGIKDFNQLFDTDFNKTEYKKIQFAYYVGELEANVPAVGRYLNEQILEDYGQIPPMHDMSFHPRSIDSQIAKKQRAMLGKSLSERHTNCLKYYEMNGYNITSKIYRGADHIGIFTRNNPSLDVLLKDIRKFYKNNDKFHDDVCGVKEISMKFKNNQKKISER